MKNALQRGDISLEKLVKLRKAIDNIARDYKNISFISFADTILLKSNWSLEYQDKNVKYTPEIFFSLAQKIRREYKVHLNLDSYAIFTQGSNEYYESSLLHISKTKNHICLNSLGVPFADLLAIDEAARHNIRNKIHTPKSLYMDEHFYHSLKTDFKKESLPNQNYKSKMQKECKSYYYDDLNNMIQILNP